MQCTLIKPSTAPYSTSRWTHQKTKVQGQSSAIKTPIAGLRPPRHPRERATLEMTCIGCSASRTPEDHATFVFFETMTLVIFFLISRNQTPSYQDAEMQPQGNVTRFRDLPVINPCPALIDPQLVASERKGVQANNVGNLRK